MEAGVKREPASITLLLAELGNGNRAAEPKLAELIHGELRRVAGRHMRRERNDHTLQATALVNEAWIRLAGQADIAWQNRAHFFAVASGLMRQILVDHARRRLAEKRGGGLQRITVDDNFGASAVSLTDILAVHQALDRLKTFDERASRIVELHFFGGMPLEEIAHVLQVSSRTIRRDWSIARAWLHSELARTGVAGSGPGATV